MKSVSDEAAKIPAATTWGAHWTGRDTVLGLWAPGAQSVSIALEDGSLLPTERADHGWHKAVRNDMPPGTRYKFSIDGNPVPDPASRNQPFGPSGWSEIVDPGAYEWEDSAWRGRPWQETVLYELHVGTFSAEGSFLGAVPHLDHLVALGVTMVELMPVATCPGDTNWGYDGVLPYAPQRSYGTPDHLKALVDACHRRGISVILDVVYNHFGPAWNLIGDYAPGFFTDRHNTPWGDAIDFDGETSKPVRAFFADNAVYWLVEFHMDGLRLDAVQAIFDDGEPHILDEIADRARRAIPGRHVHLTLENDDNRARFLERTMSMEAAHYEAQWNDDFHHVLRVLLTGRTDGYYSDYARSPLDALGRTLAEGFSYQGDRDSVHRPGLRRGTASAHLPPVAFVNFLQNHDQVGNTPFGRRLTALTDPSAVRLGTAVLLLAPGIPMLFMGQEWGSSRPFNFFCDFDEPLAGLVREGRRSEFAHLPEFSDPAAVAQLADPNSLSTRDDSKLDWTELGEPAHAGLLAFHRRLLSVRASRIVPLLPRIGGNAGRWNVIGTIGPNGGGALEASWTLLDGRRLVMAINFSETAFPWSEPVGDVLLRLNGKAGDDILAPWDFALVLVAAP